jgi:hypothetical protein
MPGMDQNRPTRQKIQRMRKKLKKLPNRLKIQSQRRLQRIPSQKKILPKIQNLAKSARRKKREISRRRSLMTRPPVIGAPGLIVRRLVSTKNNRQRTATQIAIGEVIHESSHRQL